MFSEEERKARAEEGFRLEMERQDQYNKWLKDKKDQEEMEKILQKDRGLGSGSSETNLEKYFAGFGLVGGLIIILFGQKLFSNETFGVTHVWVGLLTIVIGFFPRLLMLGLWASAGFICFKAGYTSQGFNWGIIGFKNWIIIISFLLAGFYISKNTNA